MVWGIAMKDMNLLKYKTIINAQGLKKSYFPGDNEVPILHNIDLTVNPGEFLAIMGPSGSGKSTLMNILGCLDRPTAGEVTIMEKDLNTIPDKELAQLRGLEIGFVFQNFSLVPRMSALQNVLLPTHANKRPGVDIHARARELLRTVGLEQRLDHKPSQLSGGQSQRVAIARALINEPALILADEPTGNLDSTTSEEIMELFSAIHKKGSTLVMITHDAGTAIYADRTIHIKDGYVENN